MLFNAIDDDELNIMEPIHVHAYYMHTCTSCTYLPKQGLFFYKFVDVLQSEGIMKVL